MTAFVRIMLASALLVVATVVTFGTAPSASATGCGANGGPKYVGKESLNPNVESACPAKPKPPTPTPTYTPPPAKPPVTPTPSYTPPVEYTPPVQPTRNETPTSPKLTASSMCVTKVTVHNKGNGAGKATVVGVTKTVQPGATAVWYVEKGTSKFIKVTGEKKFHKRVLRCLCGTVAKPVPQGEAQVAPAPVQAPANEMPDHGASSPSLLQILAGLGALALGALAARNFFKRRRNTVVAEESSTS